EKSAGLGGAYCRRFLSSPIVKDQRLLPEARFLGRSQAVQPLSRDREYSAGGLVGYFGERQERAVAFGSASAPGGQGNGCAAPDLGKGPTRQQWIMGRVYPAGFVVSADQLGVDVRRAGIDGAAQG